MNARKMLVATACVLLMNQPLCAEENSAQPMVNTIAPSSETLQILFTPPTGWRFADRSALPPSIKVMVVGEGKRDFPPSMSLGMEAYSGTLKEMLKTIKSINETQGGEWKDLGSIRTEAGDASLSQLDVKTEWGDIRMMHVVLVKDGNAYILTSAALKEEFPQFYKEFFNAMRSLRFEKS